MTRFRPADRIGALLLVALIGSVAGCETDPAPAEKFNSPMQSMR